VLNLAGYEAKEGAAMDFNDITPEQREKIGAYESAEDILALAREEG
jgi:hypothetical protein